MERLVHARLLVVDRRSGADVIEVAHESLLRRWPALAAWLEADADDLKLVDAIERAAGEWVRNNRDDAWLDHRAERLAAANRVSARDDFRQRLGEDGAAYLAACRNAEVVRADAERQQINKTRRFQKRAGWALGAVAVLLLFAMAVFWQVRQTSSWEATVFASKAEDAFQRGYCDRALRLAVAGLPPMGSLPVSFTSPDLEAALSRYGTACRLKLALPYRAVVNSAKFSSDGKQLLTSSRDKTARLWNLSTGQPERIFWGHTGDVTDGALSPDGHRVLTVSDDKTARLWDASTGAEIYVFRNGNSKLRAGFSADGKVLLIGSNTSISVWDVNTVKKIQSFEGSERVHL